MNINYLRTLLEIEAVGSYSTVAENLDISQPAVTKRVRYLEEVVGGPLVKRVAGTMTLTPRGSQLARHARRILAAYDRMCEDMVNPASFSGTVRLGAVEALATTWFPDFVADFNQRYPKAALDVVGRSSTDLLEELEQGRIDLAFMMRPPAQALTTDYPLGSYRMNFVARRGSAAGRSIHDLAGQPILGLPRGSGPYGDLMRWLAREAEGEEPNVMTFASIVAVIRMSEAGLGVGAVPGVMAKDSAVDFLHFGSELPALELTASYLTNRGSWILRQICQMAAAEARAFCLRNAEHCIAAPEVEIREIHDNALTGIHAGGLLPEPTDMRRSDNA